MRALSICRTEVSDFALAMEKKLRKNDCKGGWVAMPYSVLLGRLAEEMIELSEALLTKQDQFAAMEECIDVGNFAMMIHDKLRNEDNLAEALSKK